MDDDKKLTEAIGQICWLEIPVRDISRAKRFYAEIFAWELLPASESEEAAVETRAGIHTMSFFRKGEQLNGAFVMVEEANHIVNYHAGNKHAVPVLASFCVLDCMTTLNRVSELGGKTHFGKTAIGNDMGYYARFIDTEGNMVGIWSPE